MSSNGTAPAKSTLTVKSPDRASANTLSSLPADAQGSISAALGKDDSSYWARPNANGFRYENPQQALVVEFTRTGAEVRSHNLSWGLETRGYGYGDALHSLKAVAPEAKANRVEYRRDSVTEWYENGPMGLEQGFTLAQPTGKANGQPLTVELALRGDLVATREAGGTALDLKGKDGATALRYTGLKATDATGRELHSWLEVRGDEMLVRIDDTRAQYPVVVDPWVQQAELTSSDGKSGDWFGSSVAVSGSTAAVGAPFHMVGSNSHQGVAYVFLQSDGKWIQQAELTASDGASGDQFGSSVTVSGSMAIVGAPGHGPGAAYVFVQSGGTWIQQAELTESDPAGADQFGSSVAVSGKTLVVGAALKFVSNQYQGAAYVFAQSGTTWTQEAELTASDGAYQDKFGLSVAVSGKTVVVGAPKSSPFQPKPGAAYVFVESGTTWSQQAELTASDGEAGNYFGQSVALSGSTLLVGAAYRVGGGGAAYVFVPSGASWIQQAELTGVPGDYFGQSVALSGSTAVVGAPDTTVGSNQYQGAAYMFLQSGTKWIQQTELMAFDGAYDDFFGTSVAVNGSTVVVGAPYHAVGSNSEQGAAYVFVPPATLTPPSATYPPQKVGTTSAPKTFTLTNNQTAALTGIAISTTGDFAVSAKTCRTSLAAKAKCTVSVTFKPTTTGKRTGKLTIKDSASNSPQTANLTGTGN